MNDQCDLVEGLVAIGEAVGRSRSTVIRWINQHSFPACRLPNGCWATTPRLIDRWILARRRAQLDLEHGKESKEA